MKVVPVIRFVGLFSIQRSWRALELGKLSVFASAFFKF